MSPTILRTHLIRFAAPHRLLLAALMLLALARVPQAATHLDFARDLFIAWRFLHGEGVPLAGPILAAAIHLGPVWYWLLAALLALTQSWFGSLLLLGLLSATQYPLAYLAGKALHGRTCGMLWAVLLALPTWSAFEWLLPQHYVLTAPLVLTVLLCLLRYRRRPRARYLAGIALGFVLALHAHPSSVGLLWPVLAVVLAAAMRRRITAKALLIATALAALPLLPYLWWSWQNGFADLHAGSAYLGDARALGSLSRLPALVYESVAGGAAYWIEIILGLPSAFAVLMLASIGLVVLLAAAGLWRLCCQPEGATRVWQVLAVIAAMAATIACIRSDTTYYMTTPLRVVMLGGIALGLAALGSGRWRRVGAGALLVAVLGFNIAALVAANRHLRHGDWPFDFAALFDVIGPRGEPQPLPLLPASAMRASGGFLCDQSAVTAHGAYARHLLHDYAIEMRLACGRADVEAGGTYPSRLHWLGLGRALADRVGVESPYRIGSLRIVPVRQVLSGDATAMAQTPRYPVHVPQANAPGTRRFTVQLQPGERIAVSEIAFFIDAAEVAFDGEEPLPRLLGGDAVSRVYACTACTAPRTFELRVSTAWFADTDIVVF